MTVGVLFNSATVKVYRIVDDGLTEFKQFTDEVCKFDHACCALRHEDAIGHLSDNKSYSARVVPLNKNLTQTEYSLEVCFVNEPLFDN